MDTIQIIILAAGHGKRMKSTLPKALLLFKGEPMISRIVSSIEKAGFKNKPIVVISPHTGKKIKEALKDRSVYAIQNEQLGTGHAVYSAKDHIKKEVKNIMVLYADHPLVQGSTVKKVVLSHIGNSSPITMATTTVSNFDEWRAGLHDFGRIKRNKKNGHIIGIVEKKDANPEELQIKEVNPSYFCFDSKWLFENLPKIKNENAQKEYYLTELAEVAADSGIKINNFQIDPVEAMGANTPEQLALLEKLAENHVI
ncbi:MAG: NTP transferase domain-containing protein [Candidatus Paceibacterota bacterium]|jgi:bifunctional UDP-N-acetylglucosamine pyrophosphorylase/glucosamine-1-phosphate N-acetyltransferase